LGDRLIDDLGRLLERGIEERLVGPELLPGIDGAGARRDRKQEKYAGERGPEAVLAPARPLGAAHDLVEAEPQQPRHQLELGDLLAVAPRPRVGGDRLLGLAGERTARVKFEAQCGWKA